MAKPIKDTTDLEDLQVKHDSENLSDQEFEELLFEDTSDSPQRSPNLPIIAGFGLLGVLGLFLLQQIGILPWAIFSDFPTAVPLIGLFLILVYGLFPRKRRNRVRRKRRKSESKRQKQETSRTNFVPPKLTQKPKLKLPQKSLDKILAGVCGGLAQYIGMDPTMFRILFIIAALFTAGTVPIVAYILLAIFMPPSDQEIPTDKYY